MWESKSQSGFTLIEIIVATTILSFMIIGVISISTGNIDTKDAIVAEDRKKVQVQSALARLERDFTQIFSPLYFSAKFKIPQTTGTSEEEKEELQESNTNLNNLYKDNDRFAFANSTGLPVPKILQKDKKDIEFLSSNHQNFGSNAPQSVYAWIRYRVEENDKLTDEEKEQGLGTLHLVRSYDALDPYSSNGALLDEVKEFEVLKYITEFEFQFWDKKKKKFVSTLKEISGEENQLRIDGIRISFSWKGLPNMEPQKFVRTFVPQWPPFDPKTDEDKKSKAKSGTESPVADDNNDGIVDLDENEEY